MSKRTALYELYDANNVLLYVGISGDPDERFAQHAAVKKWWPAVAVRQITWHPSRDDAGQAEAEAIRSRCPRHNRTLPGEDGRVGAGRPCWIPNVAQVDHLAALHRAAEKRAAAEAELRAALAACDEADIPIARLAKELNVERKTVYRYLGRPMK